MRRERRKTLRVEWNSSARIYEIDASSSRPCIVSDISNLGVKVTGVNPTTVPDEFMLRITPHRRPRKCRVLWRSHSSETIGAVFIDLFPDLGAPDKDQIA
jgi:hypothetical protein